MLPIFGLTLLVCLRSRENKKPGVVDKIKKEAKPVNIIVETSRLPQVFQMSRFFKYDDFPHLFGNFWEIIFGYYIEYHQPSERQVV